MKLLFDTHAFIWWDGDQSKLSAAALEACQSPVNSLHLSLANVWELQIKMQLGKLTLRLPLADVLRDQQRRVPLVCDLIYRGKKSPQIIWKVTNHKKKISRA